MVSENKQKTTESSNSTEPSAEDTTTLVNQFITILTGVGLGGGSMLVGLLWSMPAMAIIFFIYGDLLREPSIIIESIGLFLGGLTIAYIYYKTSDPADNFISISAPSAKVSGIVLGITIGLFTFAFGIDIITEYIGIGSSDHGIYDMAMGEDAVLSELFILSMIPVSILIVGPAEELIFRGLVQNHLATTFENLTAIIYASVIFAAVHIPAYFTTNIAEIGIALTTIFTLSIVLGTVYNYTKNLIVPMLIHGLYNATLFGLLYLQMSGTISP